MVCVFYIVKLKNEIHTSIFSSIAMVISIEQSKTIIHSQIFIGLFLDGFKRLTNKMCSIIAWYYNGNKTILHNHYSKIIIFLNQHK